MPDSSSVRTTLLVLYSARLEECRGFYGGLGLDFTAEQHGQGPKHYAVVLFGKSLLAMGRSARRRRAGC
jgi:hypothetical protein